jgi:SAM-dependent methyltransferase
MEFLELKNISERYLELVNPSTPEKILVAGRVAGMRQGGRVIDFGCGYGEALVLWAREFGISGVGIDIRPAACERARRKITAQGLGDRLEIVCGPGAEYAFTAHSYDVASCLGATFIWRGGFQEAVRAMRRAIMPSGRLIVGEAYWLRSVAPPEYVQGERGITTEDELLRIAHEAGFELVYVLHSSRDEWDHYESENWRGLSDWLDENPTHPTREEVLRHLQESQEEYVRYGREYLGWALYVLKPTA